METPFEHPDAQFGDEQVVTNSSVGLRVLLERVSGVLKTQFSSGTWVLAEVHDIREHQNGHFALTLVDPDDAKISARAWLWSRGGAARLRAAQSARGEELRKGEKVFVLATPNFDATFGFRLIVLDLAFAEAIGPAERALREARKRLLQDGIHERNRRLPQPNVPLRIALLVPRGAAGAFDFIRILERERARAPVLLTVFEAVFQSGGASKAIPDALLRASAWRPDVIVLARGGGDSSDLIYLNDYEIGSAICRCSTPVWAGIGHAKDSTLIDEVANRSFKTPSDVAHEIVALVSSVINETHSLAVSAGEIVARASHSSAAAINHVWRQADSHCQLSLQAVEHQYRQCWDRARGSSALVAEKSITQINRAAETSKFSARRCIDSAESSARERRWRSARAVETVIDRLQTRAEHAASTSRTASSIILDGRGSACTLLLEEAKDCSAKVLRTLDGVVAKERGNIVSSTERCSRVIEAGLRNLLLAMKPYSEMALLSARSSCSSLLSRVHAADLNGPLARGFAMVTSRSGRWIRSVTDKERKMDIVFGDGRLSVTSREGKQQEGGNE